MIVFILKHWRILSFLGMLAGLGTAYYMWKDHVIDIALSKVRLDAMMESEKYRAAKRKEADRLIAEAAERERALHIAAGVLAEEIRKNANENSCVTRNLSDDDVRLLNATFNKGGATTNTKRDDARSRLSDSLQGD